AIGLHIAIAGRGTLSLTGAVGLNYVVGLRQTDFLIKDVIELRRSISVLSWKRQNAQEESQREERARPRAQQRKNTITTLQNLKPTFSLAIAASGDGRT